MITRDQAYAKLTQLITSPNLIKHCLAVEAAMLGYAKYFHIPAHEQEFWAIAGLIHDADWQAHPDQHPKVILSWLSENNVHPDIINAVAAHGFAFNIEPESQMALTLRAVDELTGLITAVALVKNKSLAAVTVESVLKKWPEKSFAAGASRADIEQGTQELGIPLKQHIAIVLSSMQSISATLGL